MCLRPGQFQGIEAPDKHTNILIIKHMKDFKGMKLTFEEGIKLLIQGETVQVPDEFKQQVKERLREIKKHCTTVLYQLKNN